MDLEDFIEEAMVNLSWKPVRNTAVYCSPAWRQGGLRCTVSAYRKANDKAKRLAAALGKRWRPRVWENLGWHYSADLQAGDVSISVYHHGPSRYWASLMANRQFQGEGASPMVAVKEALAKLGSDVSFLTKAMKAAKGCV
jgi:hypothetical protein